jgi:hypothetical protein
MIFPSVKKGISRGRSRSEGTESLSSVIVVLEDD